MQWFDRHLGKRRWLQGARDHPSPRPGNIEVSPSKPSTTVDEQTGPAERPDEARSSPCGADAPLPREQTIVAESLTDVQDEEDPEGYGFGV